MNDELKKQMESVPVRSVSDVEPVIERRASQAELQAARQEGTIASQLAEIHKMLSASQEERVRRHEREKSAQEIRKLQNDEMERRIKNLGALVTIGSGLIAALVGSILQIIRAWKGQP